MANFKEHIIHANDNLDFLNRINTLCNDKWDWQVTICFYSALHLMNAHVVKTIGKNYITHKLTSEAINPFNNLSLAKVNEVTFLAYNKLLILSRRSRYLLGENFTNPKNTDIKPVSLTSDKHFVRAIKHLDVIMKFMEKKYDVKFKKYNVVCNAMKKSTYYFEILKPVE